MRQPCTGPQAHHGTYQPGSTADTLLIEQRKIAQEQSEQAEWILRILKQSSLPHLTEPPRREKQHK